jgi:hypothetical protein
MISTDGTKKLFYLEAQQPGKESIWREFLTQSDTGAGVSSWESRVTAVFVGQDWSLFQTTSDSPGLPRLPLPMMPSEPTCRCSMVIQLLSSRPARANVKRAALAQLWLLSFQEAVSDLVSPFLTQDSEPNE